MSSADKTGLGKNRRHVHIYRTLAAMINVLFRSGDTPDHRETPDSRNPRGSELGRDERRAAAAHFSMRRQYAGPRAKHSVSAMPEFR